MATTGDAPLGLLPRAHDGSGDAGDALNAMSDPSAKGRSRRGEEVLLPPRSPGSWGARARLSLSLSGFKQTWFRRPGEVGY
jgi:hypothetical protein